MNDNAVVQEAKSTSRSPELLAKYTDTLLKKSGKVADDQDLEAALNDIMLVFKVGVYGVCVFVLVIGSKGLHLHMFLLKGCEIFCNFHEA